MSEVKRPLITPNMLTNFRIIITFFLLYLMMQAKVAFHYYAGVLFVLAAASDFFDGVIARKTGLITNYGKIADPIADKFLTLGMYSVFVVKGVFSVWWLMPLFFREVLVTVLRLFMAKQGKVIAAESAGKLKVGFQIASLVIAWFFLLARDYVPDFGYLPALKIINYVFFCAAVFLTVYSGVIFMVRNDKSLVEVGFARFVGNFCGCGLSPIMPGTVGSLGTFALFFFIKGTVFVYLFVMIAVWFFGIWSSFRVAEQLDKKDPSEVVIDEVLGMLLALFLIPVSWQTALTGFVLFRFFDILKPWPVKVLEKARGGFGIMLDDVAAGIMANVVLRIVIIIIG